MAAEDETSYKPNWPEDEPLSMPVSFKEDFDWMGLGITVISATVLGGIMISAVAYGSPSRASQPDPTRAAVITRGTPIGQGAIICPPDQEPTSTPRLALIPTATPTVTPTPEGYIKPPVKSPSPRPLFVPSVLEVEQRIVIIKCYPSDKVPSPSPSADLFFHSNIPLLAL